MKSKQKTKPAHRYRGQTGGSQRWDGGGRGRNAKKPPKLLPFFMNSLKDLEHQIVFKTRKRNRGKHA